MAGTAPLFRPAVTRAAEELKFLRERIAAQHAAGAPPPMIDFFVNISAKVVGTPGPAHMPQCDTSCAIEPSHEYLSGSKRAAAFPNAGSDRTLDPNRPAGDREPAACAPAIPRSPGRPVLGGAKEAHLTGRRAGDAASCIAKKQ